VSQLEVAADIRDGWFGIAIPLIPIVEEIQASTGDTLA